jgi:glycosyltransferase involved in cell wall biosynthesis
MDVRPTAPQARQGAEQTPAGVVAECDVAVEIPSIAAPRAGIDALVLVRLFSEPIAMLDVNLPAAGLSATDLAREIAVALAPQLNERFEDCGLSWTGELPIDGLRAPRTPLFVTSREAVQRDGPSITVAICTHDRPDSLGVALASLMTQRYEKLEILIIDNAPTTDRTRQVVSGFAGEHPAINYAVEPRPGLSWARNRAAELAGGEVVAWVDDDVVCDPWWATEIARGFVEVPAADVVTGTVVPSELETRSQVMFDQYSSVRRRRGFTRAVFSGATRGEQSPLYPMPPFGIGANMAFRRDAVEAMGGFDCALGAGTVTRSAEDTAAFSAVLLNGGTVVYQPSAIVHHRHRQDDSALRDLMLGHGRGLGAFYTSMVLRRPGCTLELARLAPRAIRDQFSSRGQRLSRLDDGFPPELLRANRLGLIQGPWAYVRARLQARQLSKRATQPPDLGLTPIQSAPPAAPPDAVSATEVSKPRRVPAILLSASVITAAGTLLVAIGFAGSRSHQSWAPAPFWAGWIISTLMLGIAITGPGLTARGRLLIVTLEAVQQSFVRWMYSPLSFTFPDELSHWRTATDILTFHHLFHANPRLPVSPLFPGLEEVTTSLVSLTHVGLFAAGLIVASVSHITLSAAVFYLSRRVGGSVRIAGIAAFLYALNPLHAGFDSMFIYQAPALLLGVVALETALDGRETRTGSNRASVAVALVCLAGLIITHHLTAAVFIGTLGVGGILIVILSGIGPIAKRLVGLFVVAVLMAAIWVGTEASPVISYLGNPLSGAISGLLHFGGKAGRVALPATGHSSGGLLTVMATIVTALLVLSGAVAVWRRPRDGARSVLMRVFAVCALSYFGVLLVREFAPDGAELSGRLLVFAELVSSAIMAFAMVPGWPVRESLWRFVRPAAIALMLVIFLGAKFSGWPASWEQLPGTFHVAGFESGVDRQNMQAVEWFRTHAGRDRRVVCEASVCALVAAYAEATPIAEEGSLYYSTAVTPEIVNTIHRRRLEYLFVDLRMSREAPITGHFFHASTAEAGSQDRPVPLVGLTKFSGFPGIQLIYDSGPIQIYDLRELPYG